MPTVKLTGTVLGNVINAQLFVEIGTYLPSTIFEIIGTATDDILTGAEEGDTIEGEGGNDQVFGGTGGDTVDGGEGDDLIFGGVGDDVMIGGMGVNISTAELALEACRLGGIGQTRDLAKYQAMIRAVEIGNGHRLGHRVPAVGR